MPGAAGVSTAIERDGGAVSAPVYTAVATTPVTFVCSVESGALETQVVRLAASVRRWGGSFATCPFLAITPRRGMPLDPVTLRALQTLDVTYIHEHVAEPYGWYKYMTKLNALAIAERCATTDTIVWLDADTLVLTDAPAFRLPDGDEFGACVASSHGGTTGPGDLNEPWWAAMSKAVGLSIDDLPWAVTCIDQKRVRLNFNAGVFAYRRSSNLRDTFHDCLRRILDAGAISRRSGLALVEQAALSLAVARLQLRYRDWPEPYNFNVGHGLERYQRHTSLSEARILHYHNYMRPDAWPQLMAMLQSTRPQVARWLAAFGPVQEPRLGWPRDVLRSMVKAYRRLRTAWYERAQARPV